jgi:hypothetical protein
MQRLRNGPSWSVLVCLSVCLLVLQFRQHRSALVCLPPYLVSKFSLKPLSPVSADLWPKRFAFGFGLAKSGTTSICSAFEEKGINVIHGAVDLVRFLRVVDIMYDAIEEGMEVFAYLTHWDVISPAFAVHHPQIEYLELITDQYPDSMFFVNKRNLTSHQNSMKMWIDSTDGPRGSVTLNEAREYADEFFGIIISWILCHLSKSQTLHAISTRILRISFRTAVDRSLGINSETYVVLCASCSQEPLSLPPLSSTNMGAGHPADGCNRWGHSQVVGGILSVSQRPLRFSGDSRIISRVWWVLVCVFEAPYAVFPTLKDMLVVAFCMFHFKTLLRQRCRVQGRLCSPL